MVVDRHLGLNVRIHRSESVRHPSGEQDVFSGEMPVSAGTDKVHGTTIILQDTDKSR